MGRLRAPRYGLHADVESPTIHVMDERWVLIDPNTGLHVAWYFWLRVLDEANRATRYGIPFGLLLLEVVPDDPKVPDRTLEEAMALVPEVVRGTDLAGAIDVGRVGIVLPHQDEATLGQAQVRILARLEAARFRGVSWQARMLGHPQDAAEISSLLTNGWSGGRRSVPRRRAAERAG